MSSKRKRNGQGEGRLLFSKSRRKGEWDSYVPSSSHSAMVAAKARQRRGYGSVARTRGAAVQGETKYFDTELQPTAISAVTTTWVAGTLVDPTTTINLGDAAIATPGCLFAPKVSAALNGRIGRKVLIKKVKLTGVINVPTHSAQATGDAGTKIRAMLVLDQQTNASAMTSAQLLNDAGNALTTISSFQNPNNFGRFKVLKDKTFFLGDLAMTGAAAAIEQSGTVIPFKMSYVFKRGLRVDFNATNGGTVADIIDNSLHVVCGANNVQLIPSLSYYSRVSYVD